ncbi:MAG: MBL fold metallo-hydrolase [Bacteroidota bacterium]
MMTIHSFVFNPFYENTYVVHSPTGRCVIIDPGCYEDFEYQEVFDYLSMNELKVEAVINTHCHIDHVLGNERLKKKYNVPLKIPKNELEILNAIPILAPQWGITGFQTAEVDQFLVEGEKIILDEIVFEILEVPGHSPGHQMFYNKTEKILIGGDVLFRESIGRTDLPGGDHSTLITNIQQKVYSLPDDVTVFPGHGPSTTIGHEKKHNPFVKG